MVDAADDEAPPEGGFAGVRPDGSDAEGPESPTAEGWAWESNGAWDEHDWSDVPVVARSDEPPADWEAGGTWLDELEDVDQGPVAWFEHLPPSSRLMGELENLRPDLVDTDMDAVEMVAHWARLEAHCAYQKRRAAAELARRASMAHGLRRLSDLGVRSHEPNLASDELSIRLGIGRRAAQTLVRSGRAFEGVGMPTACALEAGEIDAAKADLIIAGVDDLGTDAALEVQEQLLDKAPHLATGRLHRELATARAAVDPTSFEERCQRAAAERRVDPPRPLPDGMASLYAVMPAVEAIQLYRVIDSAARSAKTAGDQRTLDQLRADAFAYMGAEAIQSGWIGSCPRPHADEESRRRSRTQPRQSSAPPDAEEQRGPLAADEQTSDPPTEAPHGSGLRTAGEQGDDPRAQGKQGGGLRAGGELGRDPLTGQQQGNSLPVVGAQRAGSHAQGEQGCDLLTGQQQGNGSHVVGAQGASPPADGQHGSGLPDAAEQGCSPPTDRQHGSGRPAVDEEWCCPPAEGQQGSGLPAVDGQGCSRAIADAPGDPVGEPCGMRVGKIGGKSAHVRVVVPLTSLMGGEQGPGADPDGADDPAHLEGYGPIPASVARALAAGGPWARMVTDPVDRTVLEVSREVYEPPAAMAELVRVREPECAHPTCGVSSDRCDLHHKIPWPIGPTSVTNLDPDCRRHHVLVTHGGWHYGVDDRGRRTWVTPTGLRYVQEADGRISLHKPGRRPPAGPPSSDPLPPF